MNADPRATQPSASGSALDAWDRYAAPLVKSARDLAVIGQTFAKLGRKDLAIRSRKLQWRAEELLHELAVAADAESRFP